MTGLCSFFWYNNNFFALIGITFSLSHVAANPRHLQHVRVASRVRYPREGVADIYAHAHTARISACAAVVVVSLLPLVGGMSTDV